MKNRTRRIVSALLVICMCVAMLPGLVPTAKAVTPAYSVSSAYKASSFYSSLLEVELTGNQRDDIINVALSQVGYIEGSYSGDTGGSNDGSYSNYTEYNYWYHNNISSGMPLGGSSAPWCATFVSWCAEQAQIPTSILKRSTAAGHSSYYFNVNFYAGASTLASSSDNDSYFMGYNYTPQKGDLFFTRSWSHVGLVISSDGTYVTTVEGNTNSGGSAEGEGVYMRTRLVDDLYFGVPEYEDNSVKDYVTASCTYYPAHCQVIVDSATPINSQPRSVSTEDNSVTLENATAGQTYTATALYCNSFGNYWYRVETVAGETGYLYAGDSSYVEQITSDITLTGYAVPSAHVNGNSFSVTGTIASKYNKLNTAACYIYSGFGQGGTAATGYSDSVSGNQYTLGNSTIDYNVKFGSLANGNYTYSISATYTNYYATGSNSIASNTGTVPLLDEYFVVITSSTSQSTCSHSYTNTTIDAASCTTDGAAVQACSICGLVSETTVAATGHSFGGWTTVNSTCTTAGSKTRICATCGYAETQTIAAGGHDYSMVTHAATCSEYEIYEYACGKCGDNYKLNAGELASSWINYLPTGLDANLFNAKTQYRYSDYETLTSYETALSGYTLKSSEWITAGTNAVSYVKSWNSGFDTSNSLYATYNNASSKAVASETATTKTVIDSDELAGYLWFHWCTGSTIYSTETKQDSYTNFHAFYSTTCTPSNYDGYDAGDGSYKFSDSTACSNCVWYWPIEVYTQNSTTYNKLNTFERWTDFSAWSDTAYTASDTRQVETQTVYQLKSAALGDHSYQNGVCTACGDTLPGSRPAAIQPKYPSLLLEDEVLLNVYCTISDADGALLADVDPSSVGVLTWSTPNTNGTIDDAEAVCPGAIYDSDTGYYCVTTKGIAAKNLGDTIYFKIYVQLPDGSYVYTSLLNYSPKTYSMNILNTSSNTEMKSLVAAMLNYGAAAQTYFGYKPYSLVNNEMTEEHKALVANYSASMLDAVVQPTTAKKGAFTSNTGFSKRLPSISCEGAFSINYYLTPAYAVAGNISFYIWDTDTYNSVSVLTTANADQVLTMIPDADGAYVAVAEGIAAKELDRTIYVAAIYTGTDGTIYNSGIMPYSIGAFCVSQAASNTTMQPFAKATAVYGYYAKTYFSNL